MSDDNQNKIGRRAFFGAIGGAAASAAALTASGARAQAESQDEMRKARYQESDEVKTFYRVNGYETKSK
jgi:nitrous oxide reductase